MKELSIEEKAKAYDEALERAKILYNDKNEIGYANAESVLEEVFPLLKESEDEKIRKDIISFLKSPFMNENITDEKVAPWIAWLEKQKPVQNTNKEDEEVRQYIIRIMEQKDINVPMVQKALTWLEKQGESSDKIHYWTEEEIEPIISDYLRGAEHYGGMIGRLRCLKPKSLEKQGEKSLTVDIESMIEAYEQRLINQGNGVRNSPIVNMCVAAFKHGIENTLDELHLKQGETSLILSNSSNIGKDEQKLAWSCEDETRLQACLDTLQAKSLMGRVDTVMTNWLKSLKQRIKGE